jgi:uncharacterized protein YbjT (DUF2867 family)
MPHTKYKALVLGSSGLIGMETINLLLKNNKYETIYAITRSELPINNNRLIRIIADYHSIETHIKDLQIDHFFCCIGSTKAKTPDRDKYYEIDLEYPKKVASNIIANGTTTLCLVSSIGANPTSNNFYLKLKGDVEESLKAIGFKSFHIFRPSLLLGNRKEFRLMEKIAQLIYPIFNFLLIGKLKDYRSIKAKDIASAMINVSITSNPGVHIYQTQLIKELA